MKYLKTIAVLTAVALAAPFAFAGAVAAVKTLAPVLALCVMAGLAACVARALLK